MNDKYYDLIDQFRKITGLGVLLNTSFNLHGEPIVDTPEDALSTFQRSELDVVLINDYLISRNNIDKLVLTNKAYAKNSS